MSRHSNRISALLACIFSLLCVSPLVHAQNVGTVRLREERPIFPDYAVFEPNSKQFVRVICQTGEYPPPAKPTIELVYPLVKAQAGETLLITSLLPCYDNKNGYFVQVITQQNRVGITQLPNYQHLVETTDAEGAFQVLSLFSSCPFFQTAAATPRVLSQSSIFGAKSKNRASEIQ